MRWSSRQGDGLLRASSPGPRAYTTCVDVNLNCTFVPLCRFGATWVSRVLDGLFATGDRCLNSTMVQHPGPKGPMALSVALEGCLSGWGDGLHDEAPIGLRVLCWLRKNSRRQVRAGRPRSSCRPVRARRLRFGWSRPCRKSNEQPTAGCRELSALTPMAVHSGERFTTARRLRCRTGWPRPCRPSFR